MATKKEWKSSITTLEPNRLITYGVDQEDIISSFSYEEMIFLLIFGRKPETTEATMLRHVILSHCSHGITGQSALAVRMGADTGATFLNAVAGGFMVGSGVFHQGGLERSMLEIVAARESGNPAQYVREKLVKKEILYGFGHRFFRRDPRAILLMDLCDKYSFTRENIDCVRSMEKAMSEEKGIYMNIEAAGGAILLDLSFPIEIASLIILIGRGPMLAATYMERLRELKESGRFFPRLTVYDEVNRD